MKGNEMETYYVVSVAVEKFSDRGYELIDIEDVGLANYPTQGEAEVFAAELRHRASDMRESGWKENA